MSVLRINRGDTSYPATLFQCLGKESPETLSLIGNAELIGARPLALFCSIKCPGTVILKTYDLAQKLREAATPVIGGFHSPVERECLTILLRGRNPIAVRLARGLERMRIRREYHQPLADGRLLLLSPFSAHTRQADAKLAARRNTIIAALADSVFVAHAETGSRTEALCRDIVSWGKSLYVFDESPNANLLALGAKPITDLTFLRKSD